MPRIYDSTNEDVQVFSTAGTFTWAPVLGANYKTVTVFVCGAGGGGGGGASGTSNSGGGAGGGSALTTGVAGVGGSGGAGFVIVITGY